MSDIGMIEVLKMNAGQGPKPWHFMLEEWKSITGGTTKEFNEALLRLQAKYPSRLIITRPYNLSASPIIEVPAK